MQDVRPWSGWDGIGEDERAWACAGWDALPVGYEAARRKCKAMRKAGFREDNTATRLCPVCGVQFTDRANKLYCCHACQKKAYKLRVKGRLAPVYVPGMAVKRSGGYKQVHILRTVWEDEEAAESVKETSREQKRRARRESRRERRRRLRSGKVKALGLPKENLPKAGRKGEVSKGRC